MRQDDTLSQDDIRSRDILIEDLVVINLGLREFAQALEEQGIWVVHVDWQPPAAGQKDLMALLDRLL